MIWFGELPKRWLARRIGVLFSENTTSNADLLSDNPMQFRFGEIVRKRIIAKDNAFFDGIRRYTVIRPNDIMVNGLNLNYDFVTQRVAIVRENGCMTPAYISLRPNDSINPKFACYLLKAMDGQKILNGLGTGIRLTLGFSELKKTYLPLPPRDEQDQIVRYLDWKVSRINRLVRAKRRQIELLREQKQMVINEAMSPNSKSWEIKPLKYWAKSNLLSLGANTAPDYELEYLDISSIGRGYVKQDPAKYTFADAPSRARRVIKYGDTIISTVRTYLRSVCFVSHDIERCIVSTGFSVLTPNERYTVPELLSFALTTDVFVDEVIRNSVGVSYPAINDGKLMSLKIGLPRSIDVQQQLHDEIKSKFVIFDKIISLLQKQIFTITEYRTRLISDAVTGKLDVRTAPIPDDAPSSSDAESFPPDEDMQEGSEEAE